MISADVAHAIHPNYSEKHEKQHQPKLNQVIRPILKFFFCSFIVLLAWNPSFDSLPHF